MMLKTVDVQNGKKHQETITRGYHALGSHQEILKYINWLVVSTPLKNMSSSVGIIIPQNMEEK